MVPRLPVDTITIDGCYIATANLSSNQATDHCARLAHFAIDAVEAAECTVHSRKCG